MVRSAALRRSAFNLLNACSIGLRSGEYFGSFDGLLQSDSLKGWEVCQ